MGSITFRITGDPSAFKAAMGDVSASLDKAGKKAESVSASLGRMGNALSLGVTAPIVAMGVGVVKAAADMEALRKGLDSVATASDTTEKQLARLKEVAKLPGLGFKEAIQGSVALQSAGFSAQLAERSMKAFGNALATVGKGKAELDGVTLALTQMATKTKFSAEEVNQLAERMPQIRKAMLEAFGTADTEQIQKMGLSNIEIITKIVEQFEKLKQVSGGTKNAFENLQDALLSSADRIGTKLLPAVNAVIPRVEALVIGIADAVDGFTKLPPQVQNTAIAISAVAIAAGPTIKAIDGVQVALASMRVVAGTAGLAIGALFSGVVIAGIVQTMTAIDKLNERYKDLAKSRELFASGKADPISGLMESGRDLGKVKIDLNAISQELNLFGTAANKATPQVKGLADENKNAGDQALWHTENTKALHKVTTESEILQRLYTDAVSAHGVQLDKVADIVRSYGVASFDSALSAARLADEQFRLNRALEAAPDISARLPFKDIPKAEMPRFEGDFEAFKRGGENIGPEGMLTREQASAIKDRYKQVGKAGVEATRQVSLVMNDLAKGITDVIFKGGKMGDMLKNVAMQSAQSITRLLIEGALSKLASKILDVGGLFGKVFGGGTGAVMSAVPGAAGSVAGSVAGSAATGVSGAAGSIASSSITGMVGAVTGVVSAFSDVFSNFQFAAMNKSLDLIEKEVRYSQIHLLYTLEKANEYWPYMKSIWESLIRTEERGMAGAGGMTFDFRGATFGASFNQDDFAKNLVKTLKNNGL